MPKNEAQLQESLGTDKASWNKNCLVPYPREFDKQIDLVAEAVRIAHSDPAKARAIIQSLDTEPMKRWFIDVGQNSGFWRAKFSGVKEKSYEPSSHLGKPNADELDALFERDNWRCRYCGIRVGGRGEHFKRFAKLINLPELAEGELNETRHGLRLMLQASYDHVQPKNQGGSNDQDNLVTACWSCQYGKGKYSLAVLKISESPLDKIWEPHGTWCGLQPH